MISCRDNKCAIYDLKSPKFLAPPGKRFESIVGRIMANKPPILNLFTDSQYPQIYPERPPLSSRGAEIIGVTSPANIWCRTGAYLPGQEWKDDNRPAIFAAAILNLNARGPKPNIVHKIQIDPMSRTKTCETRWSAPNEVHLLIGVWNVAKKHDVSYHYFKFTESGFELITPSKMSPNEKQVLKVINGPNLGTVPWNKLYVADVDTQRLVALVHGFTGYYMIDLKTKSVRKLQLPDRLSEQGYNPIPQLLGGKPMCPYLRRGTAKLFVETEPNNWRNMGPYQLLGRSVNGKFLALVQTGTEQPAPPISVVELLDNK